MNDSTIYRPEKTIWTSSDYEHMGWHDATIHALSVNPSSLEILFDIDYIFKWVDPPVGEEYFKFWVAPATLAFEPVFGFSIDLSSEVMDSITLQGITRRDPREVEAGTTDWEWVMECNEGDIVFRAQKYQQFTRRWPTLVSSQSLDLSARGGVSFSREVPAA